MGFRAGTVSPTDRTFREPTAAELASLAVTPRSLLKAVRATRLAWRLVVDDAGVVLDAALPPEQPAGNQPAGVLLGFLARWDAAGKLRSLVHARQGWPIEPVNLTELRALLATRATIDVGDGGQRGSASNDRAA